MPDDFRERLELWQTLGLSDDFWPTFHKQYPGVKGWVRFSAPAYSDAPGDAVVYVRRTVRPRMAVPPFSSRPRLANYELAFGYPELSGLTRALQPTALGAIVKRRD
jgi:hypothetical protein